jgi:hypothetical protein
MLASEEGRERVAMLPPHFQLGLTAYVGKIRLAGE